MSRWLTVLGAIVALDLLLRLVVPLPDGSLRLAEGALYLVGAGALAGTASRTRRDPPDGGGRGLVGWVAALFALAGLRSLLWGLGVPVATANLGVLAVAVVALGSWLWRRRR